MLNRTFMSVQNEYRFKIESRTFGNKIFTLNVKQFGSAIISIKNPSSLCERPGIVNSSSLQISRGLRKRREKNEKEF